MGSGCDIGSCARSVEVFDLVQRGAVAAAVIPIENSLAGSVTEHFDLLLARQVFIARGFLCRFVHHRHAPPGARPPAVVRAFRRPLAGGPWPPFFWLGLMRLARLSSGCCWLAACFHLSLPSQRIPFASGG